MLPYHPEDLMMIIDSDTERIATYRLYFKTCFTHRQSVLSSSVITLLACLRKWAQTRDVSLVRKHADPLLTWLYDLD